NEERFALAIAQRWVVGVVAHLPGGVEAAPWARMVVAQQAVADIGLLRRGADQEMARFFLERVRNDWTVRGDEVAQATLLLAPVALQLAQLSVPAIDSDGRGFAEAVQGTRLELGDGLTELHEALFTFALAERVDRRVRREAA
ncbi:MAG: hypothetical protein WCI61_09085, partial [Chloroflexota bacterium]